QLLQQDAHAGAVIEPKQRKINLLGHNRIDGVLGPPLVDRPDQRAGGTFIFVVAGVTLRCAALADPLAQCPLQRQLIGRRLGCEPLEAVLREQAQQRGAVDSYSGQAIPDDMPQDWKLLVIMMKFSHWNWLLCTAKLRRWFAGSACRPANC